MKFRLGTIAYAFALLAAGMAAFGNWGILAAAAVVVFWAIFLARSYRVQDVCLALSVIVAASVLLIVPANTGFYRGPSTHSSCRNNMKQILLALSNYESAHGTLPPAFVADANGKPMHSWRVLILPYMEQSALFKRYQMGEPWDGPNNRQLWDKMPDCYRCPGCELCERWGVEPFGKQPAGVASYFAVVGEQAGWSAERARTLSELEIGGKSTILVLEHGGLTSPWTAPSDLTVDEAVAALTDKSVPGHPAPNEGWFAVAVTQAGRVGGLSSEHAVILPNAFSEERARAALALGGAGDDVADDADAVRFCLGVRWRYARIYTFGLFAALAFWPGVRKWRRPTNLPPV